VKKVESNKKPESNLWKRFIEHAPAPLYTLAGIIVVLIAEIENSHHSPRHNKC